jgi:WD40 repeat protein
VSSVAYSPDGKHIASASQDQVKIWDSSTGKVVSILHCHRPIVCCCVYWC